MRKNSTRATTALAAFLLMVCIVAGNCGGAQAAGAVDTQALLVSASLEETENAGPGGPGGMRKAPVDCFEVTSGKITMDSAASYYLTLELGQGYRWAVTPGTDVTAWFTDGNGNVVATDTAGVATVTAIDSETLNITLDTAAISDFTFNGSADLFVQPSSGAVTDSTGAAVSTTAKLAGQIVRPTVSAEGEVYGSAFTNGGSCAASQTPGGAVAYEGDGVKLMLTMDGLDDSKIDSSHTTVTLIDGDGYYTEELDLKAASLTGQWADGQLTYNLESGDLIWNTDDYPAARDGQGREWSCFGGDGSGNYYFNARVSGITYNGLPVSDQTIRIHVYIYGRSATDLAVMNFGTLQPSWAWEGEGDKPILCDAYEDSFAVSWPAGVDASGLTENDVSVVLKSECGDELTLKAGTDFVLNEVSAGKTEIAVRYQYWAFTPVYTTMTIKVSEDKLEYDHANYTLAGTEQTYDIASVYAYSVQSGGQALEDHAVCFAYYGVKLDSWEQVQIPVVYRLTTTDSTGAVKYYAQNALGIPVLTDDPDEAVLFDGTGTEDYNYQLVDGHLVYMTLRYGQTVEKWAGGKVYTFSKEYDSGMPWIQTISADDYGSIEPVDQTIETLPGYALGETWLTHGMWAWIPAIGQGWVETVN